MPAETIEDVSYNYEEEGKLVRRELKKEVLTKGAWATVMFLFQELDRQSEEWGEPKCSIVRFKKSNGQYRKQSSFNISSEKQARQIVDVIERWYSEMGTSAATSDDGPAAGAAPKKGGKKKPAAEPSEDEGGGDEE